ncbi:MAG: preprotein translocase [Proteobacteria bacterium]|nr:MAG: preprotein translocase [Pseudomonadota bacterium]
MLGLSLPEILFLAVLALVVIGPKQLPEVARTVGRFLNELRRASSSLTEEFKSQIKIDPIRFDDKPLPPHYNQPPQPPPPPPAQDAINEPEIVVTEKIESNKHD